MARACDQWLTFELMKRCVSFMSQHAQSSAQHTGGLVKAFSSNRSPTQCITWHPAQLNPRNTHTPELQLRTSSQARRAVALP